MISMLDEIDSPDEMDDCVWSPRTTRLDESGVEVYLKAAYQSQRATQLEQQSDGAAGDVPQSCSLKRKIETAPAVADDSSQQEPLYLRDDETALKLLYSSHYDIEAALIAWKQSVLERKHWTGEIERPWTEEEQAQFEEGLKTHGKNFRLIQQEVKKFYFFLFRIYKKFFSF